MPILDSVTVAGINETLDNIEKWLNSIAPETMKYAAGEALIVLGTAIKERIPVRTGEMSAYPLTQRTNVIQAGVVGGAYAVSGWVGFVGMMANIAFWVEYGHRIVTRRGGRAIGRVKPHPFMRPALAAAAGPAFERFGQAFAEKMAGGPNMPMTVEMRGMIAGGSEGPLLEAGDVEE